MFRLQDCVQQNDKIYVKTDSKILNGYVWDITNKGIWIEDSKWWLQAEKRLLEFVGFDQISSWAIE